MSSAIVVKATKELKLSTLGMGVAEVIIPAGAQGVVVNADAYIDDWKLKTRIGVYFIEQAEMCLCDLDTLEVVNYPHDESDEQAILSVLTQAAQLLLSARSLKDIPRLVPEPRYSDFLAALRRAEDDWKDQK